MPSIKSSVPVQYIGGNCINDLGRMDILMEDRKILRNSLYSVQMAENKDCKNSGYGIFTKWKMLSKQPLRDVPKKVRMATSFETTCERINFSVN